MNPIGLISMQYARPFTAEHFPLFAKMREHGFDFVELLVPEVGELDIKETRKALDDAGLGVVLAARVNLQRNLASAEIQAHRSGVEYLKYTVDCAAGLGAKIVGGPLHGLEGFVDDPSNPRGIVLSVDVLRQGLLVRLPAESLEALP